MSDVRSALSIWIFPPTELSREGATLRVRIASGLWRTAILGALPLLCLLALKGWADPGLGALLLDWRLLVLFVVAIGIVVVIMHVLSPSEEIVLDPASETIRNTRTYVWLFSRTQVRHAGDIRGAVVDRVEVKDHSGKQRGGFVCHPILQLKNGIVERLTTARAFLGDDAVSIVDTINGMLRVPAKVQLPDAGPSAVKRIDAAIHVQQERRWARALGCVIMVGGLVIFWPISSDVMTPYEATVIDASPRCHYHWKLSERRSEDKSSDCSFTPSPDIAPQAVRPKVYRGLDLEVRFRDSDDRELIGRLFVSDPEATRARDSGKLFVTYNPQHKIPVGQWPGYKFLWMFALLELSGLFWFFLTDIRAWLGWGGPGTAIGVRR